MPEVGSAEGEEFAITRAERVTALSLGQGKTVLVPISVPEEGTVVDFAFLSSSQMAYLTIRGRPGVHATFAQIIGYTTGVDSCPLPVGSLVKFPTPTFFLAAIGDQLAATTRRIGTSADVEGTTAAVGSKRARDGQAAEEQPTENTAGERVVSSVSWITDLDGVKHATGCKKDLTQRAKDLFFAFRAVDKIRWSHVMGTDLLLQHAEYGRVVDEQATTRAAAREPAFQSCGLVSRIQSLSIVKDSAKLRLLLTGAVLTGEAESLQMEDFVAPGFPIATGNQPDVFSNANLGAALRNIEATLVIFLSPEFRGVFTDMLDNLEGFMRPLELVSADFLKHSVVQVLAKFFRVVRSQASTYDQAVKLSTPECCAAYLKAAFSKLSSDLSDDLERKRMEDFYNLSLRKVAEFAKPARPVTRGASRALSETTPGTSNVEGAGAICGRHIGAQLGAVYGPNKTKFSCAGGSACKKAHVDLSGFSAKQIQELISTMPASMQGALSAAASKRT